MRAILRLLARLRGNGPQLISQTINGFHAMRDDLAKGIELSSAAQETIAAERRALSENFRAADDKLMDQHNEHASAKSDAAAVLRNIEKFLGLTGDSI